jgi:hypothetical protein
LTRRYIDRTFHAMKRP